MPAPEWPDLLHNGDRLSSLYSRVPPLQHLVLRSVHLSPYGSGVTLRVEFPRFPDRAPSAWSQSGCDTFEAQLRFTAVGEDLQMRGMPQGALIDVELTPLAHPWMRVLAQGPDLVLRFTAANSMYVNHLNAYDSANADPYTAPRRFDSRVDEMLYQVLPPSTRKPFYDH